MTQEQRSLLIRGMGAFAAVLVVLLAASFALVEIVKLSMARPRPRLLFAGYETS